MFPPALAPHAQHLHPHRPSPPTPPTLPIPSPNGQNILICSLLQDPSPAPRGTPQNSYRRFSERQGAGECLAAAPAPPTESCTVGASAPRRSKEARRRCCCGGQDAASARCASSREEERRDSRLRLYENEEGMVRAPSETSENSDLNLVWFDLNFIYLNLFGFEKRKTNGLNLV